jgi:hypothetical protein
MAIHAGEPWEMGLTMAFETESPNIPTDQKETIWRSVGSVADLTPFHFYREMLKNPGTSLFRMTFKTGIDIEFIPCSQAGPCPTSVRSMAIRAFQCTF